MRVVFLLLLIAAVIHGGSIKGKIRDFFSGVQIGERLRNVTGNIRKALEGTFILKISDRLKMFRDKVLAKLTLSPEKKAALMEKLRKLKDLRKDHVNPAGDSIAEINQKNHIGEVLFQSDIVLTRDQAEEVEDAVTGKRAKRQAYKDSKYPDTTWVKGVFYGFHPVVDDRIKNIFLKAVNLWEKDTCLNFSQSTAGDHIEVTKAIGCYSHVGRAGGRQDLSLGKGCDTVGIAAHELGHALGLYHTMSRHDRDNFVTVNMDNVKPDYFYDFIKYTSDTNENYNVAYDYGSIMHYGSTSASKNFGTTILPNDTEYRETLGSSIISFYDLEVINMHYNCKKACDPKTSAPCENGGYPHPKDCKRCLCPSGFGGSFCNQRPNDGCGKVLNAGTEPKLLLQNMGDGQERDDFTTCTYWIESPAGTQIEVEIASIPVGLSVDGCVYGGVEIKANADKRLTGYRYCSTADSGHKVRSYSNRLPVIFYNRKASTEIALKYRTVPDSNAIPLTGPSKDCVSKEKCFDGASCATKKLIGFCTKQPKEVQIAQCPKTCGHCC